MWVGLCACGSWKGLVTWAHADGFHDPLKLTSWLFRDPPWHGSCPPIPVKGMRSLALDGDVFPAVGDRP